MRLNLGAKAKESFLRLSWIEPKFDDQFLDHISRPWHAGENEDMSLDPGDQKGTETFGPDEIDRPDVPGWFR